MHQNNIIFFNISNSSYLITVLDEPISGWPSGRLEILEFVPLKVSGSIPSDVNFGGLSLYRAMLWL